MIELKQLTKQFGNRTAVDHLDLTVKDGELFGLLGPNGAGKTTTIRMLTTLTQITSGTVNINGLTLPQNETEIKALLGIVPQHFNLDPDLSVGENLDLHGQLHHMDEATRQSRIAELLAYVDLTDRIDENVRKLSGGMKRRVMIARALLHNPRVLFLDEPTVGLDPQVRRRLWDLIRRMSDNGLTVLLTTHYIEEAEALCNRVAIMDQGKLIALDSPAALCKRAGDYVVEWTPKENMETRFFYTRGEAGDFAGQLSTTATIRHSNLEDVFVELTGRRVNG